MHLLSLSDELFGAVYNPAALLEMCRRILMRANRYEWVAAENPTTRSGDLKVQSK